MAEKVGIEIELIGGEEAHRLLQNLDKDIDRLNKRKAFRSLSGLNKSKAELEGYIKELERLQRAQERQKKMGSYLMGSEKGRKLASDTAAQIEKTTAKIKEMSAAYDEVNSKQRTFMQTAKAMTSHVAHIGSAMQSLGNALTRLTSPFNRIMGGFLMGAGYKALNLFTEGISNSFERADTMKNYDRTLKALGMDVEKTFSIAGKEAMTAKENLDEAVQGLPTALDEIMAKQKIYAGATGEMVKSTATAIAANNTALASGMDARSQLYMQRYLVALSSGAELTTTQWQSMARIAPLAMRAVSKELGYADKEYAKFNEDVQKGTVSGQKFLEAFQKVGTEGRVADAARAMTESWSGLFANIRIAVTRMGANVLKTLDDTFKKASGRSLLQQLLGWDANGKDLNDGIKAWINNLSESIQNWIKANPDKILDFFNQLKSLDIKGLLEGMAEGMKLYVSALKLLVKLTGGRGLEGLGKWMVRLSMAGRALSIFGGVLKGLRHPLGWLGAGMLKLGGKLGKIGIFGKIASIFGKKKVIDEAGDAAKSVPTVAQTFKGAFSALEGLIKTAGAVLIVGTTGMIAFKEVKEIFKDLKDIGDILKEMTWLDAANGVNIALGITALTKAFEYIGRAIGKEGTLYTALASLNMVLVGGTFATVMWEVKTGLNQFKEIIASLKEISTELSTFEVPDINIDGIVDTINQISQVYDALSGGQQPQSKAGKAISGLTKAFGFMINPAGSMLSSIMGGGQKMFDAKATATKYSAMLGAIKNLKKIASEINNLASVTIAEGATEKAEEIAEAVNSIAGKMAILTKGTKSSENLVTNTENYIKAFDQLKKIADKINSFEGIQVNIDAAKVAEDIVGAVATIKEKALILTKGTQSTDNLVVNTGNISTALGKMKTVANKINALAEVQINDNAITSVEKIVGAVATIKEKAAILTKRTKSTQNLLANAGNLATALGKMKAMANKINSMAGMDINTSGFSAFIGQLKTALASLKDLGGLIELDIEVKLSGKFGASVKTAIKKIKDAKQKIKDQKETIDYTIPVNVTFSVITNAASAIGQIGAAAAKVAAAAASASGTPTTPAMGGLIYRAKGGGVGFPGRPVGTDTVPAWLTPGEYVHNKRAVNTFGLDFMRKVNNLDIKGAMNELMIRAGGMVSAGHGTTVNNYYNNNQRVVQNINTNSPDFAFRTASRFVGAF